MATTNKYIGSGMIFPIQLENGSAVIATGIPLINSAIAILVTWPWFTRWMLTEYGTRAEEMLESPLDLITTEVIRHYVIDAITLWEKRISLLDAEVVVDNSGTKVTLHLKYEVISSNEIGNFIFPFYEKIIY